MIGAWDSPAVQKAVADVVRRAPDWEDDETEETGRMSTHYEWTHAASTHPAYVAAGQRVDGEPSETEWMDEEFTTGKGAIVLWGNEALVLDGGPEAIRDLLLRCLAALPIEATCRHCSRRIVAEGDVWVDPEASGDDSVWRETCDGHDTMTAEHEPAGAGQ